MLTVIGMAIGVLVEELLPGGRTAAGDNPLTKDENSVTEWLKNKMKDLVRLLGKLGVKVAEVLHGIIGMIISWILNRAKEVRVGYRKTYGHWS